MEKPLKIVVGTFILIFISILLANLVFAQISIKNLEDEANKFFERICNKSNLKDLLAFICDLRFKINKLEEPSFHPKVYDTNGQFIGSLLNVDTYMPDRVGPADRPFFIIYSKDIDAIFQIAYTTQGSNVMPFGIISGNSIIYSEENCQGQAYFPGILISHQVIISRPENLPSKYFRVIKNAITQNYFVKSFFYGHCENQDNVIWSTPLEEVVFPFKLPIQLPIEIRL